MAQDIFLRYIINDSDILNLILYTKVKVTVRADISLKQSDIEEFFFGHRNPERRHLSGRYIERDRI